MLGSDRPPLTELEAARGLDRPLRVFPLFENALRAECGESIDEHQARVADLWARFSTVAAANPYAWTRQPRSAQEIRTPGVSNRMVSFPYPKLMNANDRVDQGAALILCSVGAARPAGVPESQWVFPVSGADAHDHWFLSHRHDLRSSPAIAEIGRRAFEMAGIGIDDVAHVDLYSCFPCAVQMAARELGLALDDPSRSLTVTGGLGFAGGPGNNYVRLFDRHHGGEAAKDWTPARSGLSRAWGVRDQARCRAVVDDATGGRIPPRASAGGGLDLLPQRQP